MNKHTNSITAAKAAAAAQKPLTAEEQRDIVIRQAQQKLGAIAEGVIYNICHNIGEPGNTSAADLVSFAFEVSEAYVEKMYGVTFHPKDQTPEK